MNKRNLVKYTLDYEKLPFEPILINYRRKVILQNLDKYSANNILEIGCGLEPIFKYYNRYNSMVVVEPTDHFFQNALSMSSKFSDKNIRVINKLFEESINEIKAIKFDFIIISCLLHELSDPLTFLQKLFDICDKDTIVLITVPNSNSFHRVLAVDSGLIKDEFCLSETQLQMQQSYTYNLPLLKELLDSQGFCIVDSGSYFFKPFTHFQMQQLIDFNIINEQILDGFEKIINRLPEWGAEIFVNVRKK